MNEKTKRSKGFKVFLIIFAIFTALITLSIYFTIFDSNIFTREKFDLEFALIFSFIYITLVFTVYKLPRVSTIFKMTFIIFWFFFFFFTLLIFSTCSDSNSFFYISDLHLRLLYTMSMSTIFSVLIIPLVLVLVLAASGGDVEMSSKSKSIIFFSIIPDMMIICAILALITAPNMLFFALSVGFAVGIIIVIFAGIVYLSGGI